MVASAFLNAYADGSSNLVTPTPTNELTDTIIDGKSFIKIYNASDLYGFRQVAYDSTRYGKRNDSLNAILMNNIIVNEEFWELVKDKDGKDSIKISDPEKPLNIWSTITGSYSAYKYQGVFDGNNFYISGLCGEPLFQTIGEKGVVKDLIIKDSYFYRNSNSYVGSICSHNYGTILGCVSTENFILGDQFLGGLVADNHDTGLISKCLNDYSIVYSRTTVYQSYGGVCGYNENKIENCQSYCDNNVGLSHNTNSGTVQNDGSTFLVYIFDIKEKKSFLKIVDGNDLSKMKFDQDLIGVVDAIENSISVDSIKKLMKPFTFMVDEEQGLYYTPKFVVDDSKSFDNVLYQDMFGGFLVDTFVYNRVPTSDIVTFCLPVDIPTEKVNGDVYVFDGYKDSTLHFSKVEDAVLTSSTPYVVKNVDKSKNLIDEIYQDTFLYNLENNVLVRDNMMHFGNLFNADTVLNGNSYVYNNGKFCQFDSVSIRPFRTFFQFIEEPSPSPRPRAFSVSFDDITTGVMMIEEDKVVSDIVTVYDALGRVVRANVESATCFEGLSAGVYVVNGQKFIVKE